MGRKGCKASRNVIRAIILAYTTREILQQFTKGHYKQAIEGKAYAKSYAKVVVFLSHSHYDRELIEMAEQLLTINGSSVYIDHRDPELHDPPSSYTALKIREKIKSCQKFVMVASDNARASKWVPWELGYADGMKEAKDIAILPVQETSGSWKGTEYVGLYPTIEFGGVYWWVCTPVGNQKTDLENWLKT